jgi:hypothetical protein
VIQKRCRTRNRTLCHALSLALRGVYTECQASYTLDTLCKSVSLLRQFTLCKSPTWSRGALHARTPWAMEMAVYRSAEGDAYFHQVVWTVVECVQF